MNSKRVAIFIDNSNVFHSIQNLRKTDDAWTSFYNPLTLGKKLAGERTLVFVGFYCVRPPAYLLNGSARQKLRYSTTQKYYSEIEKLNSPE